MSPAQLYPWLKALHVASALIFVGGVFSSAVFLRAASVDRVTSRSLARAIRRWDRMVTTPAMLLLWALGLILASTGGWLANGWLLAKLALVVLLSGIHGMQSGWLRRFDAGAVSPRLSLSPLILGCVVGIAILAVVKPF